MKRENEKKIRVLKIVLCRPVLPSVEPGYLSKLLPDEMPVNSEKWQDIMKDLNQHVMPGVTHWQSPNFHAFYPSQTSYPSIVAEMISASIGVVGFSWVIRINKKNLEPNKN